MSEEAASELLFWQQLPRLRLDADIWPSVEGVSIRIATDASDFGWGGHTMDGPLALAHEYFSIEEGVES